MIFVTVAAVTYAVAFVAALVVNERLFFSADGQKRVFFAALVGGVAAQVVAAVL